MEKWKKILFYLLFVTTMFIVEKAYSQSTEKIYSLNELVNISFAYNPLLKSNDKTIQAGLKQIDYLDKEYLPLIFFDLNISRWDWVMPNKQKYLGNSLNDLYAAFRVNQLIYDWNKNSLQKEYADKSVDIDRNFTRKLKQAFTFSIAKSYLELLKSKRTVQIQEEAINQLREHFKNADALYKIGKVSNLDVIKANIQIEVALDELSKAKNQLDVQKNNLNVVCGNILGENFDVIDNVDELWNKYSNTNYNFDELQIELISHHPDIENINTLKKLKDIEIEIFSKEYYPNFYAFGITNVEDSKIPMGNFNWNVGLTVSYSLPFFKGSNFQDKIEQTKIKVDALLENKNAIIQQLESNIKNNLLKLNDVKSRLSGTQKIVKLAEESLTTANMKYNIGKGNSLDVLDAETILTTAKLNYNQLIIDFLATIAELNYSLGSDNIPFNK